jgi:hypothetical protein
MDILNRIDQALTLDESGLRNIKDLTSEYKEADIYFHIDLDGVTSAIAIKEYIKRYGIKVVAAHPIQYGGREYAIPRPKKGRLAILCDFAHGKPVMHIHTDHHEDQVGADVTKAKGAVSFVKTPSNAAYISQVLSPTELFPPKDIKIISTVDSADFSSQGLTPDDIMRAAFSVDKAKSIEKNHQAMGLVTNKLLLTYKNKPNFLSDLVMVSKPSLLNMYVNIKKLAKAAGYVTPEDIQKHQTDYVATQKVSKNVEMHGNTIVQYGGGSMFKPGSYDRYTPFKNNPDAHFIVLAWPMGLLQVAKNPFNPGENPHHLGDLVQKVMKKHKSKMMIPITLDNIKRIYEMDIKDNNAIGFKISDFFALFKGKIKAKKTKKEDWKRLAQIMNKRFKYMKREEKDFMKKFHVTFWDLVQASSGGHKDITNISGLNFMGKGYVDFMKKLQADLAKEMKTKSLKVK